MQNFEEKLLLPPDKREELNYMASVVAIGDKQHEETHFSLTSE